MCDIALVVGADKMFFPDKKEDMFRAFLGGADVHLLGRNSTAWLDNISRGPKLMQQAGTGVSLRSFFTDCTRHGLRAHAAVRCTNSQIAAVAAKNSFHSTLNPLSQYRRDMSVADVFADIAGEMAAGPGAMCAPISDGAAAAVLCGERALHQFNGARAVRIAGLALASSSDRELEDFDRHIGRVAALQAYEAAGVSPSDIDVAEVHDACAFAEIVQIENLGFCERGRGGWVSERGETRLGGRIPVNPSGGLVSKGHPVGATGLIQFHELVAQLRGEAGARQVPRTNWASPRMAVVSGGSKKPQPPCPSWRACTEQTAFKAKQIRRFYLGES